jgi:multiple sugar transport system substrate-binding protein
MKKWFSVTAATMMFAALFAGCGSSDQGAGSGGEANTKPAEPIQLTVGVPAWANGEFDKVFSPAVSQKFPNITLEKVDIGGNVNYDGNILAKGLKPDIIVTGLDSSYLVTLKDTGMAVDMAPMAKAANLDLNRLDKSRLNLAYTLDGNPDLTVIPYSLDTSALYYNKDIFDRFGVAYPKDGVTWNQAIELAKKLTRTVDGVQYRGLEPDSIDRPASQLGLLTVDSKTNKAVVGSEGWKQIFALIKQIYEIPGNSTLTWFGPARDEFAKTKDLAMLAGLGPDGFDKAVDLNWDLVTYPVVEKAPSTTLALGGRAFAVTTFSSHKQAAFDVVKWWVSDEVQKTLSSTGVAPALNTPEARQAFGTDLAGFKGKNTQALFKLQPAERGAQSKYEADGNKLIRSTFQDMVKKQTDENTALRSAEEQINKVIEQKLAQ